MALPKDLLEIVVCPRCKGKVELAEDEAAFICRACKLVYEIQDDIPNFIVEEAKPLG